MESEKRQEGLITPWPAPASLLPAILARLEQRQTAVKGRSLDALRTQLAHTQWEIRAAAVRALAEYGPQTAQDTATTRAFILQALQDEHRLVRVAAVRALSRLDADIPFDRLLLSLHDPEWEVREMAVLVLGELSNQHLDPLQALLQVAQQDTHSSVREAAAYVLHTYHSQRSQITVGTGDRKGGLGLPQSGDGVSPSSTLREIKEPSAVMWRMGRAPREVGGLRLNGVRLWPFLTHYLNIFARQTPLIHKSLWLASPLFLVLWFVQNAYLLGGPRRNIHEAGLFFALFATISAGAGSAFIYGAERDDAFELTLSTPTSLRVLMLCRFMLVVGYNILLAGGASATMVAFFGGGFWDIIQLWLGPILLISSLSLMVSIMLGSGLALVVALLLEASQSLAFGIVDHTSMLEFSFSHNWQTSPTLLLLATLSLTLALFYVPRQVRLSQSA